MSQTTGGPDPHTFTRPFHRTLLICLFTLALLGGNLFLQQFSQLPAFERIAGSGLLLIIMLSACRLLLRRWNSNRSTVKIVLLSSLLLISFYTGFTSAWIQASNYLEHSAAADVIADDRILTACVSSLPQVSGDISRFIIEPIHPSSTNIKRIRVSDSRKTDSHDPITAGSCWKFDLRIKTTRGLRNNNGFDYELWLYQQGVGATAYLRSEPESLEMQAYPWLRYRSELANKIKQTLPENSRITPLILGLTLGIRNDLDTTQWSVLQKTGTSHLLAISGLHIGIAAIFGFYLGKLFWLLLVALPLPGFKRIKLSPLQAGLLSSVLFAIIYSALAGFSVPTQRACIMLVIAALLLACSKRIKVSSVLCIALLIVLLTDPVAALAGGTWLSFLAVAVLVLLARQDKNLQKTKNNYFEQAYRKISLAGRLQFFLVLILSLPVALIFSQVSLISPFVNFILIPLFTFTVVPVLLLAVLLLSLAPNLASFLLILEHEWLALIWFALEKISHIAISSSELQISVLQGICIMLLMLPFLLPRAVISRFYTSLLILPLLFGFTDQRNANVLLNMQVFDVGQGLAVLLQTREHQLLYDTGPAYRSGSSAAERVLIPEFKAGHIQNLSAMIISHSDNDHAGGRDVIRVNLKPGLIYAPKNDPVEHSMACEAGTHWIWDEVKFEFLYPFENTSSKNKNNYSCVLKVSVSNQSILLTGDIERQAEYALLTEFNDLQADIVFAPHHGSRSSSTPEFIQAVAASHIIFPTGFANRWRFPKANVLQRWKASGAQTYNIASSGQLEFQILANSEIRIFDWLSEHCRYWHQDCD